MRTRTITIVGGGLAGLALGIGLRRRGVPVVILEAGSYPRHRVCGEFISGRGQQTLADIGVMDSLFATGALAARTARFCLGARELSVRPLPLAAVCMSRFDLDALLAGCFRSHGGELHEKTAWREDRFPEGFVNASGRRAAPVENGWRWFGLKAHATQVGLATDLEMHCSPDGYTGICRLSGGRVNVCGLFRRSASEPSERLSRDGLLRGRPGSALHRRLRNAEFDPHSWCSVAGLPLISRRASGREDCCIGDALTMIAPVTGNGMSMAFEAGRSAVAPLEAYSRGRMAWGQARAQIAEACDRTFASRLFWAKWLQEVLFSGRLSAPIVARLLNSKGLWRVLFNWTR